MATCAADAVAVMDAAGWPTARVVGMSFGGIVALELVVSHPARVEPLVLLCTSAGGGGSSSFPLDELEGLEAEARNARWRTLLDSRFVQASLEAHPLDRNLVSVLEARSVDPGRPRWEGLRLQLQARRTDDAWDRLPSITCPTFIGCGRYDGIAPLANSQAMASRIGGAELHVYDGGHAFLAQVRESFDDMSRFLAAGSG